MSEPTFICTRCHGEAPMSERREFDGRDYCPRCLDAITAICHICGTRIPLTHNHGTEDVPLCEKCLHTRNHAGILDHAKSGGGRDRYTAVNLTNTDTVEFRLFRGTLKLNTILATLQLLDRICDVALNLSDDDLKDLSWTTFAAGCTAPELVQYLKERRLYVNEPVELAEEEE